MCRHLTGLGDKRAMPPPQSSSIGILGFIAFVGFGALLSCSLHKIEEGFFALYLSSAKYIDTLAALIFVSYLHLNSEAM